MVTIFLGPPGVGKGTQGVRLAETEGWAHVSTGDLLRAARRDGTELGRQAEAFMDAGELVADDVILGMVQEHLSKLGRDATVIFDGFPRTVPQAEGLGRTLASLGRSVDRVILFEADDGLLVKRISGRRSSPTGRVYNIFFDPPREEGVCDDSGEKLIHREDDSPETVYRRLDVYREQTEPLVEYYEGHGPIPLRIDAGQDMADVGSDLRRALGLGEES